MKYLRAAIVMIPLLMVSCLEVETTSKVNIDGSIERIVQLKGSAESISETSFNIPRHDLALWQVTQDSVGDDKLLYQASATFESVDALNRSFKINTNNPGVQIVATLALKEGFFFTRYFYSENIWADLPGPDLSMAPYLSQTELEALFENESEEGKGVLDSVEAARIEAQWERYIEHLVFEDFIVELREGGRRSGHSEEVDKMIKTDSDSLESDLNTTNYHDENLVWESILEAYISSEIIDEIHTANPEGFDGFYQRWQFFEEVLMDDYQFSVEMPGVIRKTSAPDVRGNRMSWDPETIRLFFGGINLEADSSVIKPWSLIIAGLLLVLTLIVTIAGFLRHRSR